MEHRARFRRTVAAYCLAMLVLPLGADEIERWGFNQTGNQVSLERKLVTRVDPKSAVNLAWSSRLGTEAHSTPVVAGGEFLSEPITMSHGIRSIKGIVGC